MLNIGNFEGLHSHQVLGASREAFRIEQTLSVLPYTVEPYFFHTVSKHGDLPVSFHLRKAALIVYNGLT